MVNVRRGSRVRYITGSNDWCLFAALATPAIPLDGSMLYDKATIRNTHLVQDFIEKTTTAETAFAVTPSATT